MIWYKTRSWGFDIEEVQVERVTESSVIIDGSRRAKRSGSESFHESKEQAKAFLIAVYTGKYKWALEQMENAKEKLEKAKAIEI